MTDEGLTNNNKSHKCTK